MTGDNDDNVSLFYKGMKATVGFAYNAFGTVTLDSVASVFGYGYSKQIFVFFAVAKNIQSNILAGKAPALSIGTGEQVIFL